MEMIEFEESSEENKKELKELIEKHYFYTDSEPAKRLLDDWEESSGKFIKVMPTEYKKALQLLKEEKMRKEEVELKTA